MFFGILLLIIGIGIILPKIPVFNILFGAFLILLGLSMFTGKHVGDYLHISKPNLAIFKESNFSYNSSEKEYTTIFGNTTLDLTNQKIVENKEVKIVTLFANSNLLLDKNSSFKIKATTLFGTSQLPSKHSEGFGEVAETSSSFDENKPYFDIEIVSLFGNSNVSYKGGDANAF